MPNHVLVISDHEFLYCFVYAFSLKETYCHVSLITNLFCINHLFFTYCSSYICAGMHNPK